MRGKDKCKILKEIRQRIADENDIPYVTRECSYQGECTGTCPRCESELRYLEQQLERRRSLGKRVSVAALCVGMALASAGCAPSVKQPTESMQTDLTGEIGPDESNIEGLGGAAVDPGSNVEGLGGAAVDPGSNVEELSGEVDIYEPASEPDSVDLTGNELSGAVKEPEPDYIELFGDVAYPDGYDYAGSEDVMVTTTGEVAWPEA